MSKDPKSDPNNPIKSTMEWMFEDPKWVEIPTEEFDDYMKLSPRIEKYDEAELVISNVYTVNGIVGIIRSKMDQATKKCFRQVYHSTFLKVAARTLNHQFPKPQTNSELELKLELKLESAMRRLDTCAGMMRNYYPDEANSIDAYVKDYIDNRW